MPVISAFFSKSPQHMLALKNGAEGWCIPYPYATRWTFKTRTANTMDEMKQEILQCCTQLENSNLRESGWAAGGIKSMLSDPEFCGL